jgi:hypothetical protein
MEKTIVPSTEAESLVLPRINAGFLPVKVRQSRGASETLDFHTSGFVTGVEGVWEKSDLTQFRYFLNLRHLSPTEEELIRSLERAKTNYLQGDNHLFVCNANPCCKACGFDVSEKGLAAAGRMAGLPVSTTGCQGQCKLAPVLSLRIGDRHQMLTRVVNSEDWRAVLTFAKVAVHASSVLVPPGDAQAFFHDPVHEHDKPDARLKTLQFLVGRFRGEGRFATSGQTFQKEVLGTFEAGGRFIALRMAASYPLADGRKDTHRALVIVGTKKNAGGIIGRAYTDDGSIHEYELEQRQQSLQFADAPPDHSRGWKRVRKVLKPTSGGFEERLEADAGEGFTTCYTISMRRITPL